MLLLESTAQARRQVHPAQEPKLDCLLQATVLSRPTPKQLDDGCDGVGFQWMENTYWSSELCKGCPSLYSLATTRLLWLLLLQLAASFGRHYSTRRSSLGLTHGCYCQRKDVITPFVEFGSNSLHVSEMCHFDLLKYWGHSFTLQP